eukprot:6208579-Pleurochrysis_carterae.AAC.2
MRPQLSVSRHTRARTRASSSRRAVHLVDVEHRAGHPLAHSLALGQRHDGARPRVVLPLREVAHRPDLQFGEECIRPVGKALSERRRGAAKEERSNTAVVAALEAKSGAATKPQAQLAALSVGKVLTRQTQEPLHPWEIHSTTNGCDRSAKAGELLQTWIAKRYPRAHALLSMHRARLCRLNLPITTLPAKQMAY